MDALVYFLYKSVGVLIKHIMILIYPLQRTLLLMLSDNIIIISQTKGFTLLTGMKGKDLNLKSLEELCTALSVKSTWKLSQFYSLSPAVDPNTVISRITQNHL